MLEYLDLTHLPFVDSEAPSYRYRRRLFKRDTKPVFLDGYLVYRQREILADCQSFIPLALTTRYFRREGEYWGNSEICLLTNTRLEYRWHSYKRHWVLLDEPLAQEDYYEEEEKGYPQVL